MIGLEVPPAQNRAWLASWAGEGGVTARFLFSRTRIGGGFSESAKAPVRNVRRPRPGPVTAVSSPRNGPNRLENTAQAEAPFGAGCREISNGVAGLPEADFRGNEQNGNPHLMSITLWLSG